MNKAELVGKIKPAGASNAVAESVLDALGRVVQEALASGDPRERLLGPRQPAPGDRVVGAVLGHQPQQVVDEFTGLVTFHGGVGWGGSMNDQSRINVGGRPGGC